MKHDGMVTGVGPGQTTNGFRGWPHRGSGRRRPAGGSARRRAGCRATAAVSTGRDCPAPRLPARTAPSPPRGAARVGQRVAGVAGDDQPVVGTRRQGLDTRRFASKPTCRSLSAQRVTARARRRAGGQPHRQAAASAFDGQGQGGIRRRPRRPELPPAPHRRRSPARSGRSAATPGAGEGELIERQRQPEAAGLDVGLLQRPVVEEGGGLWSAAGKLRRSRTSSGAKWRSARLSRTGANIRSTSMPTRWPRRMARATRPSVWDRLK